MHALTLSSAECGCDQRFQVPIHHVMGDTLGLKAELNPYILLALGWAILPPKGDETIAMAQGLRRKSG